MAGQLYESYNARSYQPAQVAEKFVWSPHFAEVIENFNTLILGPRGSGKTTLLKMLTLPALNVWKDPRRDEFVEEMDYVAIYVPSDFTWNPAFRTISPVQLDPQSQEFFTSELFNSYVKLSICDTLEALTKVSEYAEPLSRKFDPGVSPEKLENLFNELALDWKTESRFQGLFGLRHGVENQISQLQRHIALATIQNQPIEWKAESLPFIGHNLFDQLRNFNRLTKHFIENSFRWAICIDELEIAPKTIKNLALGSFRSLFDQDFRIKLSASPNDEALARLSTRTVPGRGQDYRAVQLFDQPRWQLNEFSRGVFSRVCIEKFGREISPEKLLGPSVYSADPDADSTPPRLAKEGLYAEAFRSLAVKDKSFAEYLAEKGFDVNDMNSGSEGRKARIRKLITTVIWRDRFRFSPEGDTVVSAIRGRRRRTFRTVQDVYLGEEHLFRVCEGNPRILIGVLDQLLSNHDRPSAQISYSKQGAAIRNAIASQMFLLSTLGDDEVSPEGVTLVELVEMIGEYFKSTLLSENFTPDPTLRFTLRGEISKRIENLIGLAINQGALIARPGKNEPPGSFLKSEIRLSYLIGIQYDLPLVQGRSVSLQRILSASHGSGPIHEQMLLDRFFEEDADDD